MLHYHNIFLRSFFGFSPEQDGYIGWTEEASRERMLRKVSDNDLFMIYGAVSLNTEKSQRSRVLGFLQVSPERVMDHERSSAEGMERKRRDGYSGKWSYGIRVKRAWRAVDVVILQTVAPETYDPKAGQAIAVYSPQLTDADAALSSKIRVVEVPVFGEPWINRDEVPEPLAAKLGASKSIPGAFGVRESLREDGPTKLYLAALKGGAELLPKGTSRWPNAIVTKIGISNDVSRRLEELNAGFPPSFTLRWSFLTVSNAYPNFEDARAAESYFKTAAELRGFSLGKEFFLGPEAELNSIYFSAPGVARFSRAT